MSKESHVIGLSDGNHQALPVDPMKYNSASGDLHALYGMQGDHQSSDCHHGMYITTVTKTPFLFEGWCIDNWKGLLGALILSAALSALHEAIVYTLKLKEAIDGRPRDSSYNLKSLCSRLARSVAYMIRAAVAYTVMLCAMTFNIWLMIDVSLGAGFGYFIFHPILQWLYARRSLRRAMQSLRVRLLQENDVSASVETAKEEQHPQPSRSQHCGQNLGSDEDDSSRQGLLQCKK